MPWFLSAFSSFLSCTQTPATIRFFKQWPWKIQWKGRACSFWAVRAWALPSSVLCSSVSVASSSVGVLSCNAVDCSPPGSSVHGIFQARNNWSGLPFPSPGDLPSPGITQPRDRIHVSCISCIDRWILYHLCHLGSAFFVTSSSNIDLLLCLFFSCHKPRILILS